MRPNNRMQMTTAAVTRPAERGARRPVGAADALAANAEVLPQEEVRYQGHQL
jgi:hypothetical protein